MENGSLLVKRIDESLVKFFALKKAEDAAAAEMITQESWSLSLEKLVAMMSHAAESSLLDEWRAGDAERVAQGGYASAPAARIQRGGRSGCRKDGLRWLLVQARSSVITPERPSKTQPSQAFVRSAAFKRTGEAKDSSQPPSGASQVLDPTTERHSSKRH
ncbi:unnamed protein product, partial [Mesorhabditis spiculigera]